MRGIGACTWVGCQVLFIRISSLNPEWRRRESGRRDAAVIAAASEALSANVWIVRENVNSLKPELMKLGDGAELVYPPMLRTTGAPDVAMVNTPRQSVGGRSLGRLPQRRENERSLASSRSRRSHGSLRGRDRGMRVG
jgi:hypothetical protein